MEKEPEKSPLETTTIREELMGEEAQHAVQMWSLLISPKPYKEVHYHNGHRITVSISEYEEEC